MIKKINMKKMISVVLVLVTLMSTFAVAASATTNYPSFSTSSYCEFTANKTIYAYKNSSLTQRGTYSPSKSYNAYISSGDVCRIYKITSTYIQLAYPTSSGYKSAYVKRNDVLSSSVAVDYVASSASKVTTYKYANTNASYGYISAGDRVYKVGTGGSYTHVMYPAKSGSRAYKLAYITTTSYNSSVVKKNTPSATLIFPLKGSITRSSTLKTNGYYCDYKAPTGTPIYAPADGTAYFYQKYSYVDGTKKLVSYGNHIVFKSSNGVYEVRMCHLSSFNGVGLVIPSHQTARRSASAVAKYDPIHLATKNVSKGTLLGYSGATGNASGSHLHLEVYKNGVAQNPVNVFSTWY